MSDQQINARAEDILHRGDMNPNPWPCSHGPLIKKLLSDAEAYNIDLGAVQKYVNKLVEESNAKLVVLKELYTAAENAGCM